MIWEILNVPKQLYHGLMCNIWLIVFLFLFLFFPEKHVLNQARSAAKEAATVWGTLPGTRKPLNLAFLAQAQTTWAGVLQTLGIQAKDKLRKKLINPCFFRFEILFKFLVQAQQKKKNVGNKFQKGQSAPVVRPQSIKDWLTITFSQQLCPTFCSCHKNRTKNGF